MSISDGTEVADAFTTRDSVRSVVVEGVSVSDGTEVADAFNKYFSSIAKKLDDVIPYTWNSPINYLSLVDRPNFFFLLLSPL